MHKQNIKYYEGSLEIEQLRKLLSLIPNLTLPSVSLETFTREYLHYVKTNRSLSYYKSHLNSFKHLEEFFQNQKLISTISQRDAETFLTNLREKTSKGYRVYYRNLRAAFNKAVEWGYLAENPFARIRLPKAQRSHPLFISENKLIEILNKLKIQDVNDISALSFYTGCRLGELVSLKWKNVNLEDGYIVIGGDEFITKTRTQRTIPLSIKAKDIIKRKFDKSRNRNGFVFHKRSGAPYTPNYISKMFKKACKESGVSEKIHFHTLRHSFASALAQKGVSIYVIQKLLGHSSVKTTEIYSHLHNDTLKEAIKVLNN